MASKLQTLIQELCPDGVEFRKIGTIADIFRGTRVVKNQLSPFGKYPVYQNSLTPLGRYDQCNAPGNTTFLISAGSAGDVGFSYVDFWAADDCLLFKFDNKHPVDSRFLYHALLQQQSLIYSRVRRSSVPRLSKDDVALISIPVPPLPVQAEIVRILDAFTELTTALTAELTARKKQYEYYRDSLLSFDDSVEWVEIGDVCHTLQPFLKIPTSRYLKKGEYPIIDQGQDFIGGYTNEQSGLFPNGEYVVFGDHTCVVKYINFPFAQGADGVKVLDAKRNLVMPKYLFYTMSNIRLNASYSRHWSQMKAQIIPLPPLDVQNRIVSILDQFDALCNDLTSGLPAEIAARKKQYEYYRDKLLTFRARNAAE